MAKRKLKLFLLVISGLFIFGVGYIFAQKYQDDNQSSTSSFFQSSLDSDNDGIVDDQERKLSTNPYLADSDSDGFTDKQEVDTKHNPNVAESKDNLDQDNDGLIGSDEKKFGTDLNNADSDFDGYQDGEEIANGFDPTKANLGNIKALLSQIPDEKKQEAKDITGVDLTTGSSIDSLQGVLNSDQSEDLQKNIDQIVSGANQELTLVEVKDNEIIISGDSNSETKDQYFESFNNIVKQNLNFLLDPNIQGEMISKYGETETTIKISQAFSKSADEFEKIAVPNDSDLISTHRKMISVFRTLSQKYDLIANSQSNNLPTLSQALKDILSLNKILYEDIFVKIKELSIY
ncbi:MAG: hypothetical protein WC663_00930 [Patescibacteria group bacterium]|jgi:hypothetical protein